MTYTLKTIPKELSEILTKSFVASNLDNGSSNIVDGSYINDGIGFKESKLIWASQSYGDLGEGYSSTDVLHDLEVITPRVMKTKEAQQRRVKDKAEVFSPSWLCNLQNNMVDDSLLGEGSFNKTFENDRKWLPSSGAVDFSGYKNGWMGYVQERRIEITCGEAPYLMSPYDSTTGDEIPVVDENGLFQRIGVLDRKLRVVSENSTSEDWNVNAMIALASTFGYEWQGDNLLLARLNFLNTYIQYFENFMEISPTFENLQQVSEIAAWNLWQMDGLKMVIPMSCSEACVSCSKRVDSGHDGKLPAVRFLSRDGWKVNVFESFVK